MNDLKISDKQNKIERTIVFTNEMETNNFSYF